MPNLFPAIPPGSDLAHVIRQANNNFAQIDNEANTKIFKDDTGMRRVLLGKGKDGFYGIRVSKPGFDVYTAADDELILTSENNLFKIVETGTVVVNKLAGDTDGGTSVAHGLGYAPMVFAFGVQTGGTANIQVPEIVPDLSTGLIAKQTHLYVDDTNITLSITTPAWVGNAFFTDPLEYTFRYYIIRETSDI